MLAVDNTVNMEMASDAMFIIDNNILPVEAFSGSENLSWLNQAKRQSDALYISGRYNRQFTLHNPLQGKHMRKCQAHSLNLQIAK